MTLRLLVALALCVASFGVHAADNDDHPLKNVKVGDFATYSINTKLGPLVAAGMTTQTITRKTEKEVKVKTVLTINGMDADPTEQTIDLTKPFDPIKAIGTLPAGTEATIEQLKTGKETVKAAGKEYDCTWTTYKMKARTGGLNLELQIKVWASKEVPLGIVKMEMTGDTAKMKLDVTMELSETGNKK